MIENIEDTNGNTIQKITYDAETGEIKEYSDKIKFKHIKESTVDPDAGFYHKGEHEKQFAYSASAICDKHGYILTTYIASGNIHDSITFDGLYKEYKTTSFFDETSLICFDNGYQSPAIAKRVFDDNKKLLTPYKRPMTKKGFFKKRDYIYDEFYDAYICPNDQLLYYSTTNKSGYREYKSNPKECSNCPYLSQCTSSKNFTKVVTQHVWNDYLELATDVRYEIESNDIYAKRKQTIERCFADGKEKHGLRFTRYKGIQRVTQSILLLFASMNFKKMAKWKAQLGY